MALFCFNIRCAFVLLRRQSLCILVIFVGTVQGPSYFQVGNFCKIIMVKEAFSFTNAMLSNCGWSYITYNMYLRLKLNEQICFGYLEPIRCSVPLKYTI